MRIFRINRRVEIRTVAGSKNPGRKRDGDRRSLDGHDPIDRPSRAALSFAVFRAFVPTTCFAAATVCVWLWRRTLWTIANQYSDYSRRGEWRGATCLFSCSLPGVLVDFLIARREKNPLSLPPPLHLPCHFLAAFRQPSDNGQPWFSANRKRYLGSILRGFRSFQLLIPKCMP